MQIGVLYLEAQLVFYKIKPPVPWASVMQHFIGREEEINGVARSGCEDATGLPGKSSERVRRLPHVAFPHVTSCWLDRPFQRHLRGGGLGRIRGPLEVGLGSGDFCHSFAKGL